MFEMFSIRTDANTTVLKQSVRPPIRLYFETSLDSVKIPVTSVGTGRAPGITSGQGSGETYTPDLISRPKRGHAILGSVIVPEDNVDLGIIERIAVLFPGLQRPFRGSVLRSNSRLGGKQRAEGKRAG